MDVGYFKSLASSLKLAKKPHYYATGGLHLMSLPSISLHIVPQLILGLPLGSCHQKLFLASSDKAPFSGQEETERDTAVWQMSPSKFVIKSPHWDEDVAGLVNKVKLELGCDSSLKVIHKLYKLVTYKPGGYCKLQRNDKARPKNMFATLVIQLPSEFIGGQMCFGHEFFSKEFNFDGIQGSSNIHYAAFYAGCEHEIKPVTEGFRVIMVYDLMYEGTDDCPMPAKNQETVSSILSSISEWGKDSESPPMMAYLLANKYRGAKLSYDTLKDSDLAVCDVLSQAKKRVNFDLYLGRVKIVQTWSAYGTYSTFRKTGKHGLGDLIEESITAEKIHSLEGHSISSIPIEKDYLVPEDFFDNVEPDNEKFVQAIGDSETTITKWYSWPVILVWPTVNRFVVLGVNSMIKTLNSDLHTQSISSGRKTELEMIARDLLSVCSSPQRGKDVSAESYALLLKSLRMLDNLELISQFFNEVVLYCHEKLFSNSSFCHEVAEIAKKNGVDIFASPLQAIFNEVASSSIRVDAYCQFLVQLSDHTSPQAQALCLAYVTMIVKELAKGSGGTGWYLSSPESYLALFKVIQNVGQVDLVSELLNSIAFAGCMISLVNKASFCDKILMLGKKFGWERLKPPLKALFKKMATAGNPIDSCSLFLSKFSHQMSTNEECVMCRDLSQIVVSGKVITTAESIPNPDSYVSFLEIVYGFEEVDLVTSTLNIIAALPSLHSSLADNSLFVGKIMDIGEKFNWEVLRSFLTVMFGEVTSDIYSFEIYLQFLSKISEPPSTTEQKSVCQTLAHMVLRVLKDEPNTKANSLPMYRLTPLPFSNNPRGKKFLIFLFSLLDNIECDDSYFCDLVDLLMAKPKRYPIQEALFPLCEGLYRSMKGAPEAIWLKRLGVHCTTFLEASTSETSVPPADWSESVTFNCSCNDCLVLMNFLHHPTETEHKFRISKGTHDHLIAQILSKNCSVSTTTFSDPPTLMITKTRDAYLRESKKMNRRKSSLFRLRTLIETFDNRYDDEAQPSKVSD